VRPERAAEYSPPSSAAVMEQYSYTSTHPLGHTGPLTGSLYLCYVNQISKCVRVETESDGTRRSTGGEVKGKEVNGVGSQHSCTVWEHGLSSITNADPHTSAASSRLN